jgi:hypothetical protein
MWERTLQDLIRGLRANKNDEAKFIAQANEEIRREIKSKDMELKAAAVMKLTYVRVCSFLAISVPRAHSIHCSSTCWAMTWPGPHSTSSRSCPLQRFISSPSGISPQPSHSTKTPMSSCLQQTSSKRCALSSRVLALRLIMLGSEL